MGLFSSSKSSSSTDYITTTTTNFRDQGFTGAQGLAALDLVATAQAGGNIISSRNLANLTNASTGAISNLATEAGTLGRAAMNVGAKVSGQVTDLSKNVLSVAERTNKDYLDASRYIIGAADQSAQRIVDAGLGVAVAGINSSLASSRETFNAGRTAALDAMQLANTVLTKTQAFSGDLLELQAGQTEGGQTNALIGYLPWMMLILAGAAVLIGGK